MRAAAILASGIIVGLALAVLATAHTWPDTDAEATDYPGWTP